MTPDIRVTFDYRFINWARAVGYSDLGWSDQHVFAVGGQYNSKSSLSEPGTTMGSLPIRNAASQTDSLTTTVQGHQVFASSITKLNQFLFPGITEHHISVGAGYQVTSDINVDGSFVFSPSKTVTRGGTVLTGHAYEFDSTVSQWSVALGLAYKFS